MELWEPGGVYFLPARGKAVGWVHKIKDESSSSSSKEDVNNNKSSGEGKSTQSRGGPADLLIAKVPASCLEPASQPDDDQNEGGQPDNNATFSWTQTLLELSRKYSKEPVVVQGGFVVLSKSDAKRLQDAV